MIPIFMWNSKSEVDFVDLEWIKLLDFLHKVVDNVSIVAEN